MGNPLKVPPEILADQKATRAYLHDKVLSLREHLLPEDHTVLPPLPAKSGEEKLEKEELDQENGA